MKLLGWQLPSIRLRQKQNLTAPPGSTGSWFTIFDFKPGWWQADVKVEAEEVLASHAVFACITLIANDKGKMRPKLMERDGDDIWSETESASFSPVLRRPNKFQNHIQFKQSWQYSLQSRGNTYVLLQRDDRRVVVAMYVLDPTRVQPLVADNGDVYYRLNTDNLSGLNEREIIAPASEVIHDRINCIYHPLVGLSAIFASGLSATKGLKIENNAAKFFANQSRPGGVLTAPGHIQDDTAARVKALWEEKFSGENQGKVAVLGDGLKYEQMSIAPVDAQMLEQLKWSAEVVCSTFHVPPFKIGIGTMPTYQNAEVLNQIYYSDCLQCLIEQYEACMDQALGLETKKEGKQLGVELDLDALLRMDQATMVRTMGEGVKGGVMAPNEARRRLNLKPLTGGNSVYLQQQQFSLEALAKRDAGEDPFGTKKPEPAAPAAPVEEGEDEAEAAEKRLTAVLERVLPKMLKEAQPVIALAPPVEADDLVMTEFVEAFATGLPAL